MAQATGVARRDDGLTLRWTARAWTIVDPEGYAGEGLGGGSAPGPTTTLDRDESELALHLRRGTL